MGQPRRTNNPRVSVRLQKTACLPLCLQPPAKNAAYQLPAKSAVLLDLPRVRTAVSEREIEGAVANLEEVLLPFVMS